MWGPLFISGRAWVLPATIIFFTAFLLLLWSYRKAPALPRWRIVCFLLKLLGLATLLICLLEPLWSARRARPGANFFVIVADNSQGLQIKDAGSTKTRGEVLAATLNERKSSWQEKLDEQFQVRRYLFDSRLQSVASFEELNFQGRSSSMMTALRGVRDRYKGEPLAGILLLTDGNATDLGKGGLDLKDLPPVYPVVLGNDDPIRDVAIENVTMSQTAFEDAPVTVQADINASGYAGERLVAQLVEVPSRYSQSKNTNRAEKTGSPGRVVAEQTEKGPREGERLPVRFQVRPEKTGVLYYRLRVAPKGEESGSIAKSSEATVANNERWVVVDRGRGPYRVLYVGGRPNWEFKFLNRAVADDEQVQLVGLIRIARREPKFDFRGRAGESSNPLFRGFDRKTEETERYDKPVLVRLNTRDELELRGGFPKTAEELYSYHAVIVDDLEAEFFSPDQMMLLQKFVSERGGGFLMLGGQESFVQGKFHRTPVGDMLPVYLDASPEGKAPNDLRLGLTREGWLQPWARLRSTEADEKARLESMPGFQVLNRVRGIKPGASVIATVLEGTRPYPAVVVQRFGNGRSAAVMIGDLWRSGLQQERASQDLAKSWRQLVRWLVADVPNRVEIQTESPPSDPNQSVLLRVRVRDEKFQPMDDARVKVSVGPVASGTGSNAPAQSVVEIEAEPVAGEPGLYEASYVPHENGGYHAEARVTAATGADAGHAAAGWASDLSAEEFRSLKPNRPLLEEIARKSGGEIIDRSKLNEFAEQLPHRKMPVMESWSFPLWHTPWMFLFALACFAGEWGLRRWKGLA